MVHSGLLNIPSVAECIRSGLDDQYGVNETAFIEANGERIERVVLSFEVHGVKYEFYRHPELYLTPDIRDWYNSFLYVKMAGSNIEYDDIDPKWMDACRIYESFFDYFEYLRRKKNIR